MKLKNLTGVKICGYRIAANQTLLFNAVRTWCMLLPVFIFLFSSAVKAQNTTVADTTLSYRELTLLAEKLKASVDPLKFKKDLLAATGMQARDYDLFMSFIGEKRMSDDIYFFLKVRKGEVYGGNLNEYVQGLIKSYALLYPDFVKKKTQLLLEKEALNNVAQAANGPCTNIGFEDGTFSGWQGFVGTHELQSPNEVSNPVSGFGLHCMMSPGMTDPLIPTLPVVAPGSTRSVRLGNTVNGGHAAKLQQTFRVDSSNMIFTYRYAVVLEDPQDHTDAERPYFMVRMYDQFNKEITCASYTVIAKPGLQGYNRICVNANGDHPRNAFNPVNIGCPPNNVNTTLGNSAPDPRFGCGNNMLDIYYKSWTTVSIPLNSYYGQNVRIEFTAADCEPDGHLGYAYVDAECNPFTILKPVLLCTANNETRALSAPSGFSTYTWTGPGIVGANNTQNVTVNKPGTYKVTLVPFSDNPCPVTIDVQVYDHCPTPPVTITLCEEVKGSGTVSKINLNSYNTQILAYKNPPGTLVSWHSATPPKPSNIVTNTSLTVKNGDKFYAIIKHAAVNVLQDTAQLNFIINARPDVVFPAVPAVCAGSSSFQLAGVMPAGGTFTGVNVTPQGVFNPVAAGTFPIKYTYINAAGCMDTMTRPVVVKAPPTVDAGPDQTLCASVAAINLTGKVTNATGGVWSGGTGTFSNNQVLTPVYTPSAQERQGGSITLTLTTTGTAPCPAVSDGVVINLIPGPTVDAGPDQTVCASNPQVSLRAVVTSVSGGTWSGGTGTFSAGPNASNTNYTPSASEIGQGKVTLTFTASGIAPCNSVTDNMVITIIPVPTVDAGPAQTLCTNITAISLNGSSSNSTGVTWSGGTGTFVPNRNTLNVTYTPTSAEKQSSSLTFTLTAAANAPCTNVSDDVTIQFIQPVVLDAGPDQVLCASNAVFTLAGTSSNTSKVLWSGGSGTFSNISSGSSTYTPSNTEMNGGSVILTLTGTGITPCPSLSDKVTLTIIKVPVVNAGPDQTLCATASAVTLAASASNTSGVTWSGGAGTFTPDKNSLNAIYTPTTAEKQSGSLTFTLTAAGNAPCAGVSDNVTILFTQPVVLDAGPDQNLCSDRPVFSLAGTSSNTSKVLWSGGSGTFSNINSGSSTYMPSTAELNAGTVTLTFTGTGLTPCPSVSDKVVLSMVKVMTVDAGTPQTLCANESSVSLKGTAANAASVSWSGGAGTFSPDRNSLNVTYVPTTAEKLSGSLTFTLTATAIAPCPSGSDQVTIQFTQPVTLNAGPDQTLCASTPTFTLAGTSSNTSATIWSGGNGTFSNINSGSSTYTPSAAEINTGSVTLTFTGTGLTPCPSVSDKVILSLIKVMTVDAGPPQTLCATESSVSLKGTAANAASVSWSGGSGTFVPDRNSLNVTYSPTAAEKLSGLLTFTLTATAVAPCPSGSDQVIIQFTPPVTLDAGPDQTLCASAPTFTLAATSSNTSATIWSGGNGTFSNINSGSSTYTPSAAEVNAGAVILTFTGSGIAPCPAASDKVTLRLTKVPAVEAGPAQTLCATAATVALMGTSANSPGVVWSGGNGTFSPDRNSPNATYIPTSGEKQSGSLTLTLTANGNVPCAAVSDQVTIQFIPAVVLDAGPDQTLCASAPTFTLAGTSSNTSATVWSGGNGTFSNINSGSSSYTPSGIEISNGSITLTFTGAGIAPCPAVSDKVTLTLIKIPSAEAGPSQTLCATTGTISLQGTAANMSATEWSGGTGTFAPDKNSLSVIYTLTPAEKLLGSLTFTLTASGNAPCASVKDDVTIYLVQPPVISAGDDQRKCENNSRFQLSGSVTNAGGIIWSGGTGTFLPDAKTPGAVYIPSAEEREAAAATLTITSTGTAPCTAISDQMVLAIGTAPHPDAGPDKILCTGASVTISTASVHNETYSWTDLHGNVLGSRNTITFAVITDTTVVVRATDKIGCFATDTISIDAVPIPVVVVRDTSMCPEESVILKGIVPNLQDIQKYHPVFGWKRNGITLSANDRNLSVNEAGTYTLSVTAYQCTGSDDALVKINPLPVVDLPPAVKFCSDNDGTIKIDGGDGFRYFWSPGGDTSRVVTIRSPGIYTLTITTEHHCRASDEVLVRDVCPPRLYVGDAFSPDNDGINDTFNVYGAHIGKFQLLIFNRWGEIIFESLERTHWWDGIYRSESMPIGTYPWIITYEGDTDEFKGPYKLEGSVTVVK